LADNPLNKSPTDGLRRLKAFVPQALKKGAAAGGKLEPSGARFKLAGGPVFASNKPTMDIKDVKVGEGEVRPGSQHCPQLGSAEYGVPRTPRSRAGAGTRW
jgi:hypothetical protein